MSESLITHYQIKRNLAHKRLQDALNCAQQSSQQSKVLPRFETWCSRLEVILESFNDAHTNLISELTKANATAERINKEIVYQEESDDMYHEILEIKRALLPEEEPGKSLVNNNSNNKLTCNTKLPPIKLPTFSGCIKSFPGYIDLFNTLVHSRSDLSNVEKFQYLQASLSGEPINVIRAYPICDTNYISAYSALVDRYDNKRFLAFMCWEQINNLKPMNSSSSAYMRTLLDTFNENLCILKGLGLPTQNWDFVLFHSLLTKLDKNSREAFELQSKSKVFPTFEELKSFIEDRCSALERSSISNTSTANISRNHSQQPKSFHSKPVPATLLAQASGTSCVLCKSNHPLYLCRIFLSKSIQDRFKIVKQNRLCFNCLRSNHSIEKCVSAHKCKTCNLRHNTLIHFSKSHDDRQDQSNRNQSSPRSKSDASDNVVTPVTSLSNISHKGSGSSFVMLATAEVEVRDGRGSFQRIRVLLDPGSQSHIITNACVNRLGLTRYKSNIPMVGIGEIPTQSNSKVFLEIRPNGKPVPSFTTEAVILNKICGNMPSHSINVDQYQHLSNIKLADEQFHKARPVDLLIGGELFPHILLPGKMDGGDHVPTAINTVFGFVLMGKTFLSESSPVPLSINHLSLDAKLDVVVQKFWEIDNVPSTSKANLSEEDITCEQIYQTTHSRDTDGRYIVQLPFREQIPKFEGSYQIALRRFNQLEKRLIQNPKFHQEYSAHIMEYLSTGQMEEVSENERQSPSAYYIPHHAVVKPDRKLRVVYDASTKDKNGVSLNDTLLTGRKLQADISIIILRFRLHAIVFTADVRHMYRQININKDHQDFQRILFRSSPDQSIQEYRLNRVTFGVSSAPFLAMRTMQQLAQDEEKSYPLAAEVLRSDLYVDDVVTGAQDICEALNIKNQLVNIMSTAGFELRKWCSNHAAVLQDLPADHVAVPDVTFDSDSNFVKVLGLAWNSHEDVFNYQVNQSPRDCTKRAMLSELARIYDPIGLLTPLTFLAKHLIQRLWLLGTSWDEPVPEDINHIWVKYMQQLTNLSQLHIPRRITRDDAVSYQLHGFCDASEAGYAAVVYLCATNNQNKHDVTIVVAKSRVSPTKRRTLPRLELCGASLLADLMHFVSNQFSNIINIDSVHAWSDSMIVLAWIKSKSSNFKAFVGNRVSNIQRKLPNTTWKHVPGKQNPADCASRGLSPDELVNHKLWWSGPQWLSQDEHHWPNEPAVESTTLELEDVSCETRTNVLKVTTNSHPGGDDLFDHLLNKFSSLRKIQRIVAYCYRFINALRKNKQSGHFTDTELHGSLMALVKHVQQSEFSEEIKKFNSKRLLSKPFRKLNPFVDPNGVFRVGGRLIRSELEFQAKHPALLPRKHRLTQLIIQSVHHENLHPGLQTLQYLILQNFWILSARRAIKQVISNCFRCFRYKPVALQPEMADLPKARITQIKAFQSVGCDYAGPFNITIQRYRGARIMKAYLCLFVCFATKALHLELASDLSTEAFLAALRRFIARRGRCNTIHSDCGTNFKGAQSQLAKIMETACQSERISFKFNPAGAPHQGGLWEAGVKSVKTHLYRVIGNQTLTYEELNTIITQIESILNSRPLCPLSSDPNDLSVLTPGHFLTLAPLTTVPTSDYTNVKINRLTRWQLLQRIHQDFWNRWHTEYLCTLSQRLKWTKPTRHVNQGQLVIIKDESTHPLKWRFGRIVELYYGREGIPRSATIKTLQGVISRPLVKLCPIPNHWE